jgi:hypothetical protein
MDPGPMMAALALLGLGVLMLTDRRRRLLAAPGK